MKLEEVVDETQKDLNTLRVVRELLEYEKCWTIIINDNNSAPFQELLKTSFQARAVKIANEGQQDE